MTPELSYPFHLAELSEVPEKEIEIVASEAQRAALAKRYGLVSLDALRAQLRVRRDAAGEIVVEGALQAAVVQECVVTLEPVGDSIAAPFEQRYTLTPADPDGDLVVGPDDEEPPEAIIGDTIDLGDLVAQYLSLSVNPYPRAPEADIAAAQPTEEVPPEGPFAVLAELREKDTS